MMEIILKHNIFIFDDNFYNQEIGAAMGSRPVPHYANIFMARKIDTAIKNLSKSYDTNGKSFLKLLKN